MMKYLYPQINWEPIKYVGFDLDGTLYDESNFISQVYEKIASVISKKTGSNADLIFSNMYKKWLQHGSSYNKIFDDELINKGLNNDEIQSVVLECLDTFRSFQPKIKLSSRNKFLLDEFYQNYSLFLVTDGNQILQENKILSLGLSEWFDKANIMKTGTYGKEYYKPSASILELSSYCSNKTELTNTVYFGDRECDRGFAMNANFQFIKVNNMYPIDKGRM